MTIVAKSNYRHRTGAGYTPSAAGCLEHSHFSSQPMSYATTCSRMGGRSCTGCGTIIFLGPRLRTSSTRTRSSNSCGEHAPFGRNASARVVGSNCLMLPLTSTAGTQGAISFNCKIKSFPLQCGITRSLMTRSTRPRSYNSMASSAFFAVNTRYPAGFQYKLADGQGLIIIIDAQNHFFRTHSLLLQALHRAFPGKGTRWFSRSPLQKDTAPPASASTDPRVPRETRD